MFIESLLMVVIELGVNNLVEDKFGKVLFLRSLYFDGKDSE